MVGKSLKKRFCETLLMGMSKLDVFVKLKTSKLNLRAALSVICVSFTSERSVLFCQACRKMFRWPVVKFVSKVSPGGIAPPRSPGLNSGSVKHAASSAGAPGVAPLAPVSAFEGEQLLVNGTIG